MDRHKQFIQLSNHIKNKLKQQQYSSDESIDTISTNDSFIPEHLNRTRRNTFTTYQAEQSFFTDRKVNNPPPTASILQETYNKQQCRKCHDRNALVYIEHQRLNNENRKLNEQLRTSVFLNRRYEEENHRLRYYLRKLNANLNEYEINFNQLKEKNLSEKKLSEEDKQDHLKRLRYEVQMYNRIVAAKEQQEKQNEQKQIEFFF